MTPRDRNPRSGEAGFVLIGVVIFVLALTIIGISLFSLSSYEAQFLQRSIDGEQAFQSAVGGIERAKFALAQTSSLQSVNQNLPDGVDSTVAIQDGNSTGPVIWDSTDVITIRVTAKVNGARRIVMADFMPKDSVAVSYYSSLITVNEGIEVEQVSPLAPYIRNKTVWLDGPVWVWGPSQSPSEWPKLHDPAPVDIRTSPRAPVPDVAPFFDPFGPIGTAQLAVNSEPPASEDAIYTLNASGTPGIPTYFRAEDPTGFFSFNSFPKDNCTINVSGLAVWLLPNGAMFYHGTVITGDPATACLVVIAGPMAGSFAGLSLAPGPTSSICFLGHLQTNIPVILVSSGEVLLWHENDHDQSTNTLDVAIFARSARFMGPDPTRGLLELHRDPNGPLNTLFLYALANRGALPNASSGARRLDLVPGTWQASDQ